MSYLIVNEDGYYAAQHHGDGDWPDDERLVVQLARTMGRDPDTLELLVCDGPGGKVPDQPNSVGYRNDAAVWYASGAAPPSLTQGAAPLKTISRQSAPPRARVTPLWANGYPGVVQAAPMGTTSDPYRSNVQSSTFVLPAYAQDPSDPSAWLPDTGLLAQKVAVAGGQSLPAGTPVVVLPFSITTEQQMAAVPASNQLVAVWAGGAANGFLGTLEYDVKPDGSLDTQRRARLQSSDRIYRLPTSGLLPFGARPGAGAKPFPVSSGIAWQLGLDVDGQAGYGAIVDTVSPGQPGPNRTATGVATITPSGAPGSFGQTGVGQDSGGTTSAPFGGSAGAHALADAQANVAAAQAAFDAANIQRTPSTPIGPIQGLLNTLFQAQQGLAVVQGALAALPSPAAASGQTRERPTGPTPQTLGVQTVIALTTKRAYGGHSVGEVDDIHRIGTTPDGEPVNAAHWNVRQPIDGDGFDAPLETSGVYVPTSNGGPLTVPVYFRYDPATSHPFIVGNEPGLRRWETNVPFDVPPPSRASNPLNERSTTGANERTTSPMTEGTSNPLNEPMTDPVADSATDPMADHVTTDPVTDLATDPSNSTGGDYTTTPESDLTTTATTDFDGGGDHFTTPFSPGQIKALNDKAIQDNATGQPGFFNPSVPVNAGRPFDGGFTFGGGLLLGGGSAHVQGRGDPSSPNTIEGDRSFVRSPLEVAMVGILAMPVPLNGPDTRGRTSALTPEQQAAYEDAPISAVISAVGAQPGGSTEYFPGAEPGSALYLNGLSKAGAFVLHPPNVDVKALVKGEPLPPMMPTTTFMAATLSAQFAVADPHEDGTPKNGFGWGRDSLTSTVMNFFDSQGVPGANPGLRLDQAAQTAESWGGKLVNALGGALNDVPINNGAGGYTWGPSGGGGSTNPNCVYGDGSTGTVALDGTNTFPGVFTTTGAAPNRVYTQVADVFATKFTVSAGKTVNTAGFHVYFTDPTSSNAGTIQNNANGVFGAPFGGTLGGGGTGGIGASDGGAVVSSYGGTGGISGGGHNGGTVSPPVQPINAYPTCITFVDTIAFNQYDGGSGGGSSSGDGGGGGGPIVLAGPGFTNSGTIQANGGNAIGGGNAGGGGGGVINIAVPPGSYTNTGTVQALGGTKLGTGVNGGNGSVFNISP